VELVWQNYHKNGQLPGRRKRGSFWGRSIVKFLDSYKGIVEVEAGSGETILFWKDLCNGRILKLQYPELHSFVINEDISLATVRSEVSF
jgi:hypothetical protein